MAHLPTPDAIRVSTFVLTWPRLLGLELADVARAADLALPYLEAAQEFTYDDTLAIWRALETLTGDPVVGLRAGMRFTVDQMGVVGPALAHATHLDAALDVLGRIMSAFARNTGIRRVDSDFGAGLEYTMPTLRARHGVDTIFGATVALMRECTGSCAPGEKRGRGPLVPIRVEHQMPPSKPDVYEGFFGVLPVWNSPSSRLWFARADLGLPFRGAAPELARLLVQEAPRLLKPTNADPNEPLEAAFWRADPRGAATLESTAAALSISPRTLQRRLAERNTTFALLRASLLHKRAIALLEDPTLPLEIVAERLGYTSRTTFERAFFRWTSQSPAAFRAGR